MGAIERGGRVTWMRDLAAYLMLRGHKLDPVAPVIRSTDGRAMWAFVFAEPIPRRDVDDYFDDLPIPARSFSLAYKNLSIRLATAKDAARKAAQPEPEPTTA